METLSNKIDGIFLKVKELGIKLERLQIENVNLTKENGQLKSVLSKTNYKLEELEKKFDVTQKALSSKKSSGMAGSKELKKEIDQYIVEIDKCIEWLYNN